MTDPAVHVVYTPNLEPELMQRTKAASKTHCSLPKLSHHLVDDAQRRLMRAVGYLNDAEKSDVLQACATGDIAHLDVARKSGEPYITHPIAVAEILAGFRLDRDTIVAAILHDTVEDTAITHDDLACQFGETVAQLVDGVTKLKSSKRNKAQNQAATFHKIITATLDDPRVLIIKLADRLHNMSTLGAVKKEKQQSTAAETIQFYVPFARLMGLNDIADYIEILCYRNLDRTVYDQMADKLLQHGLGRQFRIDNVHHYLTRLLDRLNISGHVRVINNEVQIYRQYFRKRGDAESLLRQYAFEVVVNSVEHCDALADNLVERHNIAKDEVADNIRKPLPGGNQSLTLTYREDNEVITVTILTKQMQETAKLGVIAAHEASDLSRSVMQASINNMQELLEAGKEDSDEALGDFDGAESTVAAYQRLLTYFNARKIVCYTPDGEPHELPRGATALDFAYAVGPKIGHVATGACIDGKSAKLGSVLSSGQTVLIETQVDAQPRAEWLGIITTSKARRSIQRWLSNLPVDEQQHYGKRSLDRALQTYDKSLADITNADWQDVLAWQNCDSQTQLFIKISKGILLPQLVVSRLFSDDVAKQQADAQAQGFEQAHQMLKNANGVEVHFAGCCYPIFGDPIIGHLTRGGLVIHRHQCYSILNKYEHQPYELVQLDWHSEDSVNSSIHHASQRPHFTAYLYLSMALNDAQISQLVHTLRQCHIGVEHVDVQEAATEIQIIVRSRRHVEQGITALRPHFGLCRIERLYRKHVHSQHAQT